ncbi:hypothetical protein [Aquitalea denitrificans]|uniref:hypothetical protein n=1 Tax=Aquitalea denitrificans TaxID=519081 RepID=UPI00135868CC|nr:hypothetical protein [Aquitalea denitrificans]
METFLRSIHMNRRMLGCLLSCLLLCVALSAAVWFLGTPNRLFLLPPQLEVQKALYTETNSWGFGPGGNETGVILYELPSHMTHKNPSVLIPELTWEATPLQGHREWFEGEGASRTEPGPLLDNYLNRYGFGIPIKAEVVSEINRAVSAQGSWYAYTGHGIIVLMPLINRVAFVYAE